MKAFLSIRTMTIHVSILFFALLFLPLNAAAEQCVTHSDITSTPTTIVNDYHSTCFCPYSFDRKGNRCGDRSAWSKTGGKTPVCFPVNDEYMNIPFSLPIKTESCPCPYNFDENGVRCGEKSVWSKSNGLMPACYTSTNFLNEGSILNTTISFTNKCICPFDIDENGERCGEKSEWTRTRGAVASCYPQN